MPPPGQRFNLSPERREEVYALAEMEFDNAIFYKPLIGRSDDAGTDLHPLIVQETLAPVGLEKCGQRFGSVSVYEDGSPRVDSTNPTIYTTKSQVRIRGGEYQQTVYLWAYPPPDNNGAIQWRGVRITVGSDGYPLAWEALTTGDEVKRIFVSASLELAAEDLFGEPSPGRRHAVDRNLEEASDVITVRVIADGPVPMGPYVYLARQGLEIATVLCRCSPSQIKRIVDSVMYELRGFEDLELAGVDPPEIADSLTYGIRWPYRHGSTTNPDQEPTGALGRSPNGN